MREREEKGVLVRELERGRNGENEREGGERRVSERVGEREEKGVLVRELERGRKGESEREGV